MTVVTTTWSAALFRLWAMFTLSRAHVRMHTGHETSAHK